MKKYNQGISASRLKQLITPTSFYCRELQNLNLQQKTRWIKGGLCPFHHDERPGSFYVNLETGAFKCFACGIKGGDIVDFVQARDKITFPQAICKLMNYI